MTDNIPQQITGDPRFPAKNPNDPHNPTEKSTTQRKNPQPAMPPVKTPVA